MIAKVQAAVAAKAPYPLLEEVGRIGESMLQAKLPDKSEHCPSLSL